MNKLIEYFIKNSFITVIIFIVLSIISVIAIKNTEIDALPDLSENQVVVMTAWPGQTPTNIEDQVTYPLSAWLQGLPKVKDVRAMSQIWISMVTVIFEDWVDEYFARDRVNERLSLLKNDLPQGVTPILWPDATGLGQIYMYTLESEHHSLTDLRTLQDFNVKLALQSIPWVAEVASIGGYKKTFEVVLDPILLKKHNISVKTISNLLKASNNNVSWSVAEKWKSEVAIEGVWFFETKEGIENILIKDILESIIVIWDIATVKIWSEKRRWILANESEEKVWGIIVMRYWENPLDVIKQLQERISEVEKSLPEGVTIESFYDRTTLIEASISTLKDILLSEIVITAIILSLFLWHFGASIITVISLVIWILLTFLLMKLFWIPSNIMSLWGIAIAIWTMVDSSIVVTENIYNKLLWKEKIDKKERAKIIYKATKEVAGPLVFAILIIVLSFVPIFALEGQEWKLFSPLAFTNMFAMLWALVTALFLIPVLSTFFLKWKFKKDNEIPTVNILQKIYKPALSWALETRKTALSISLALLAIWWFLFTKISSEFMPPLDEWSLMYMPMTVPDVSERRARELLIESNRIISEIPEVEKVVWKAWRAETATDPAPLAMLETIITLKPKSEWREGITKQDIIDEMNNKIKLTNLWNGFTQPIIWRIDMLSTWIRAEVWIKIFWDDPIKLEELAVKTENIMWQIPWGFWITAIRTTGLEYLQIDIDEKSLALYWVKKSDVLDLIETWIWWKTVTTTINWRERFGVELRLERSSREHLEQIRSLEVPSSRWIVQLSQVANIKFEEGPATINSENWVIRSAVQMSVRWMWLVDFVEKWKVYLEENLKLPEWYYIEWTGQYENQVRAKETLQIVVPTVVLIILFILFIAYKDGGLVWIVALSIPFSLVWWVIALYTSWFNFSVAVWVWFISLFWNAVETWVVMILYLENSFREKFWLPLMDEKTLEKQDFEGVNITKDEIRDSVVSWAMLRLRPILMTAFTSVIWLLPMIWSTWVWAELQKPLAIVVVWGLITSIILTLIILPILFSYLRERKT